MPECPDCSTEYPPNGGGHCRARWLTPRGWTHSPPMAADVVAARSGMPFPVEPGDRRDVSSPDPYLEHQEDEQALRKRRGTLSAPCPKCGAGVGTLCISFGAALRGSHWERVKAAINGGLGG